MPSDTPKTISIKIAIDIPTDIAAETLSKIQPVISQLSNPSPALPVQDEPKPYISDQTEEEKAEARKYYQNNIEIFRKKAIQAYRLYRRLVPKCEKPSQAYKGSNKERPALHCLDEMRKQSQIHKTNSAPKAFTRSVCWYQKLLLYNISIFVMDLPIRSAFYQSNEMSFATA